MRQEASREPDPLCVTCHGTGLFQARGKAYAVTIDCPRCRGARSIHALPESPGSFVKDHLASAVR